MSHSITAEQHIIAGLDMKASVWANRILTRKISNEQCKAEVRQKVTDAADMEGRIRKYLNAGLVTDATFKTKAQEQIERIKAQAKAPPAATQSATGSKDGLWSTVIGGRK